jgi:hypothetical protein
MELVLQQNPVITWRFEARKKLETPKNIGEFIISIPTHIALFFDFFCFEIIFQTSWFLRRVIFEQFNRHLINA